MVKHPVVKIADLRRILDGLLAHVEKVHGPELRLDQDYYWDLGDKIYDTKKKIEKVKEIGSLGDDWEFLYEMKNEQIEQDGPSLMLIHAAPLLRYIGERVGA